MATIETQIKIKRSFTYATYRSMVLTMAENSGTTGSHTEEHIAATKINAQRMKRIDKQLILGPDLADTILHFRRDCLWILMAESWCGDGAQNIPVIARIAEQSPHIELKIILRDEHPETMDNYLTNGSRSIPKLICIDKENGEVIGLWGPRPDRVRGIVRDYKQNNPHTTHVEFVNHLHLWYAKDQTRSVQEDFTRLLVKWNR